MEKRGVAHEDNLFVANERVDARARATSINITTDDLSDPEEFQRFNEAQNQLTQALGQLRTVVENYPQLASQPRFGDLMVAIDEANTAEELYAALNRIYDEEYPKARPGRRGNRLPGEH